MTQAAFMGGPCDGEVRVLEHDHAYVNVVIVNVPVIRAVEALSAEIYGDELPLTVHVYKRDPSDDGTYWYVRTGEPA